MITKYVIWSKLQNAYYTNRTYQFTGNLDDVTTYPILTQNINEAYHYSSPKRAENSIKAFEKVNPLDYGWIIKEVN